MKRFCVICGELTDDLINGMCKRCFAARHSLCESPGKVVVTICKGCLAYSYHGRWHVKADVENNLVNGITDIILDKVSVNSFYSNITVRVSLPPTDDLIRRGEGDAWIFVRGLLGGHVRAEKYKVNIKIKWKFCPSCRKLVGGKEKAILQIRAMDRRLSKKEINDILNLVIRTLSKLYQNDKEAAVLDIDEKDGLNIYLISARIARLITNVIQKKYMIKILETQKVVGISRTGKSLTRSTVRVLLPPFERGDVILFNGEKPYFIDSIYGNVAVAISLVDYSKIRIHKSKVFSGELKRVSADERGRAMVISVDLPYVQLMDMETYEVYDVVLRRIPRWIVEGKEVGVVRIGEKTYVLPAIDG